MLEIVLKMENALGEMDQQYIAWSNACKQLSLAPNLRKKQKAADEAHARYLVSKRRAEEAMEEFRQLIKYLKSLKLENL